MAKTQSTPARQRLLEAAERVFAREGLIGATTRVIAKEAGVNEVTLFRHFGSKDKLVAEVVGRVFPEQSPEVSAIPDTENLRSDLLDYVNNYAGRLKDNLALVRTLIGEIHHNHLSHEREVFRGIFRPLREALIHRLALAQKRGQVRKDCVIEIIADHINGMVFTDIVRRSSSSAKPDYSFDAAMNVAVDLVLDFGTRKVRT